MRPYLPSVAMMREWMRRRMEGYSDSEAWRMTLSERNPREWCRREVAGAHGQSPVLLSVAISGGSSVVKRGHPERWLLSDHGRWRMMHLGAIEAAYGATAYFEHLFPEIRRILTEAGEGTPFIEFSSALYTAAAGIAGIDRMTDYILATDAAGRERIRRIANEKKGDIYADLAFIDVIFKKGPESIFTLIPEE